MVDFNLAPIQYYSSSHAELRVTQRTDCPPHRAAQMVRTLAQEGNLLFEVGRHRYIRNGDLFLPCVIHRNSINRNIYVVKSVLRWDMVQGRLQRVIDRYSPIYK